LTALDGQLTGQSPAPAVRGQVKQALDTLKKFKDEELARPMPGLGYRQYPRLREDVQSLAGYVGRGFRAPNTGELERMKTSLCRSIRPSRRSTASSRRTSRRSTMP